MATRRFEFREGESQKFWEITVTGSKHAVRFGRIGTDGQSKAKTFSSPALAQKDADKLIAEKQRKGYSEKKASAKAPAKAAPTTKRVAAKNASASATPPKKAGGSTRTTATAFPVKGGRVPRWTAETKPTKSATPTDRIGGLPSAWGTEPWPICASCKKPMVFAVQLIGTSAGGVVPLGAWAALQAFVCLRGCDGGPNDHVHCAILRKKPLGAGAAPLPKTYDGDPEAALAIRFKPGSDDARLLDPAFDDDADYDNVRNEAASGKVGGVLVCGNPPTEHTCKTCRAPMRFFSRIRAIPQPYGSGTAYLYICPDHHTATYQAVN